MIVTGILVYSSIALFIGYVIIQFFGHFQGKCENSNKKQIKKLPGPVNLPGIGSLIQIIYMRIKTFTTNFEFAHKLCEKYGSVMTFKAGIQNFIFIEDFPTAKHVLNSDDWSGRFPGTPLYFDLSMGQNCGILLSRGEIWKQTRKYTLKSLIEYGFGEAHNMDVLLNEELTYFMSKLEKDLQDSGNEEITFHQYFNVPVLNILWKIMCGTRFACNDKEIRRVIQIVQDALGNSSLGTQPQQAFPILRHIPYLTCQDKVLLMFSKVHALFNDMITERRAKGTYLTEQNDFFDKFLSEIDDAKNQNSSEDGAETLFTDAQLIQICSDLTLAGSDTSANSLEFVMLYMLKYPEVQKKVHTEILSVIGNSRLPNLNDKPNMPFTEATILEVLRMVNTTPAMFRTSMRDTEIMGCYVPANTFALINFTEIHKSTQLWGDPKAFRPTRFLDTEGKLIKDSRFLAFGAGKRKCIGYTVARATIFSFFTRIIQRYSLEPSEKFPNASSEAYLSGITNCAQKFYCKMRRREGVLV